MKAKLIILSFFFILLISCSKGVTKVEPTDSTKASVDANFSPQDQIKIRDYMISSITKSDFFKSVYFKKTNPAWMRTYEMENETDENINTRAIIDEIRTKLINEIGITFIDDQALTAILEQQGLQQSDLFDNSKASKVGKMVGALIILRGQISNIQKKSDHTDINYYTIRLQAVGLETSKIIWTDEIQIGRNR